MTTRRWTSIWASSFPESGTDDTQIAEHHSLRTATTSTYSLGMRSAPEVDVLWALASADQLASSSSRPSASSAANALSTGPYWVRNASSQCRAER